LEPDLEIVGTAENGEVALQQVEALQPDVVLMDVRMPVMNGKEATMAISQRFPAVKVLVLSTYDDDRDIADAMRAGAKGYLLKDMPSSELAESIRFVVRGYTQLAPGLMEKMLGQPVKTDPERESPDLTRLEQLTVREREVLHLISTGATNKEIASQLYIAEGTVKTYVTSLFNRLNFKNRAQLAIYANSVFGSGN
jgi:DNA-binding NarL/FixJ family response regulator